MMLLDACWDMSNGHDFLLLQRRHPSVIKGLEGGFGIVLPERRIGVKSLVVLSGRQIVVNALVARGVRFVMSLGTSSKGVVLLPGVLSVEMNAPVVILEGREEGGGFLLGLVHQPEGLELLSGGLRGVVEQRSQQLLPLGLFRASLLLVYDRLVRRELGE